ncbi:MAG TPA: nuclear transport factor 2 family protein [Ilumatobacter sp.]|nr:nuclear transport factor 2 family protein [Ilumatobacter sp.]
MDERRALELSRRWWNEVWRDADFDVVDEILADPVVRHASSGSTVTSREEYKRLLADFQRTLCRPQTTIDDQVVSGDRVWTRATSRGLNRETGEPAVVTWMVVQRIVDDRIAEQWSLTSWGVDWSV